LPRRSISENERTLSSGQRSSTSLTKQISPIQLQPCRSRCRGSRARQDALHIRRHPVPMSCNPTKPIRRVLLVRHSAFCDRRSVARSA